MSDIKHHTKLIYAIIDAIKQNKWKIVDANVLHQQCKDKTKNIVVPQLDTYKHTVMGGSVSDKTTVSSTKFYRSLLHISGEDTYMVIITPTDTLLIYPGDKCYYVFKQSGVSMLNSSEIIKYIATKEKSFFWTVNHKN